MLSHENLEKFIRISIAFTGKKDTTGFHKIIIHKIILVLLSVLFLLPSVSGQKYSFDLQEINVKDGLPHSSVYHVLKDKKGYIWLSIQGGICRYDGYHFKTYSSSFLKTADINPHKLAVDGKNRLWYSESATILNEKFSGIIDTEKDLVYTFEEISEGLIKSSEVISINQSNADAEEILVTTRSGLIYNYESASEKFEKIFQVESIVGGHTVCESFEKGVYWILDKSKIFKKTTRGQVKEYTSPNSKGFTRRIFRTSKDLIVEVVPLNEPLQYFRLENDQFVPFDLKKIGIEMITSIFEMHDDYTCLATDDALVICDNSGKILLEKKYPLNKAWNIPFRYTSSFKDDQNNLWIAAEKGLLKIRRTKNPFEKLTPSKSTRAIFKDEERLLISQYGENRMKNLLTGKTDTFSRKAHPLTSFIKDDRGTIWAGSSFAKILKLERGSDKWESFSLSNMTGPSIVFFNSITNHFLFGTHRSGIWIWEEDKKTQINLAMPEGFTSIDFRQFHQNEAGIWAACGRGLVLIDPQTEEAISYFNSENTDMPEHNILHFTEDKAGIFWLGTKEGGLIRWDRKKKHFSAIHARKRFI